MDQKNDPLILSSALLIQSLDHFLRTFSVSVAVPPGHSLNLSEMEKVKKRKVSGQFKSTQENNGSKLVEVQFSRDTKASPEKKRKRLGKFFIFLNLFF